MAAEKSLEEYRAENAALAKALKDTKGAYTQSTQEAGALKAEIAVLEDVGVAVPEAISTLKASDPEKYLKDLTAYTESIKVKRFEAASDAVTTTLVSTLEQAAKAAKLKTADIESMLPPSVYKKYTDGTVTAEQIVNLAVKYDTVAKSIESPTTPEAFDFASVAGGHVSTAPAEVDKTLNKNDYIL